MIKSVQSNGDSGSGDGDGRLVLQCPAKINLTLEVLGRYNDGYHRISSIMQTISLADTLELSRHTGLVLECTAPGLSGPDNLVMRAAAMLKETSGYDGGALVRLRKSIPEASGLGGGSSDAAATLQGLNRLWGLGLSHDSLLGVAARLGSDVPFFLTRGTALAEGKGEQVTPLPAPRTLWLAIVKPPAKIPGKTSRLYKALDPAHYTSGQHSRSLAEALIGGQTLSEHMLFNVFEAVAASVFPKMTDYIRRLMWAGASSVHLAGSGPAIFAVFEDQDTAKSVVRRLPGLESYLACSIPASGQP